MAVCSIKFENCDVKLRKSTRGVIIGLLSMTCVFYVINIWMDSILARSSAVYSKTKEVDMIIPSYNKSNEKTFLLPSSRCPDLWTAVQHGRWVPHQSVNETELAEVKNFLNETRRVKYEMPATLQREDGRCGGGITYDGSGAFRARAICNRYGETPCCYDNVCVNKTESECVCSGNDNRKPGGGGGGGGPRCSTLELWCTQTSPTL